MESLKLNLKKARKLEAKINKYVEQQARISSEVSLPASLALGEILSKTENAAETFLSNMRQLEKLILLRSSIRMSIAEKNEIAGINYKISLRAGLCSMIENVFSPLSKVTPRPEIGILEAELADAKKVSENPNRFGMSRITVNLFNKEKVEEFKNNLYEAQKRLENLDDEISSLNLGSHITLTAEEVDLLKGLRLI